MKEKVPQLLLHDFSRSKRAQGRRGRATAAKHTVTELVSERLSGAYSSCNSWLTTGSSTKLQTCTMTASIAPEAATLPRRTGKKASKKIIITFFAFLSLSIVNGSHGTQCQACSEIHLPTQSFLQILGVPGLLGTQCISKIHVSQRQKLRGG